MSEPAADRDEEMLARLAEFDLAAAEPGPADRWRDRPDPSDDPGEPPDQPGARRGSG